MSWSAIIGQEKVKLLLKRTLENNKIAHAYLFYGAEGVGKDALAIEFAKAINCLKNNGDACDECENCMRTNALQHPNVKIVFALPVGKNEKNGDDPEKVLTDAQIVELREQLQLKSKDPYHHIDLSKANFIKINSIRGIKRESAMSRVEKGKKIFILLNADMMNPESGNSLLKTLEEPLPETVLILTTSAKDKLLPTIVSRCQSVKCDFLKEDEIENALIERDKTDSSVAHLASRLANGSYSNARRLCLNNITDDRNDAVEFLRLVLGRNKESLLDAIETLSSSIDRAGFQRWFKILRSWLRDAMIIQQEVPMHLVEKEKNDIDRFLKNFSNADLIKAIQTVDKAIAHLDKNVYLPLIMTNLAIDLKKNITEKASL